MDGKRRVVVEAIDKATECVISDVVFDVDDIEELRVTLGIEPDEYDMDAQYLVEPEDISRLKSRFGISIAEDGCRFSIRPWRRTDALPYKIHTNRELALMLAGTKPLAAFIGEAKSRCEADEIPERLFEPYVKRGLIIKREHESSELHVGGRERKFRRVLYALPGQEWRIDAYLLLHEVGRKSGWNEGFEIMEGVLLGYEEWQIDAYIKMMYRRGNPASDQPNSSVSGGD